MRVGKPSVHVWCPGLMLAATLTCAPAGAAPVTSAAASVVLSMGTQAHPGTFFENLQRAGPAAALLAPHPLRTSTATELNPIGGVLMAFLSQIASTSAYVTTLHDFLATEEPTALSPDAAGVTAPQPRQVMVHGLLADLDLALHALQEGGDEEHFMASRETGPGAYLRVAQQSRFRSGLY